MTMVQLHLSLIPLRDDSGESYDSNMTRFSLDFSTFQPFFVDLIAVFG